MRPEEESVLCTVRSSVSGDEVGSLRLSQGDLRELAQETQNNPTYLYRLPKLKPILPQIIANGYPRHSEYFVKAVVYPNGEIQLTRTPNLFHDPVVIAIKKSGRWQIMGETQTYPSLEDLISEHLNDIFVFKFRPRGVEIGIAFQNFRIKLSALPNRRSCRDVMSRVMNNRWSAADVIQHLRRILPDIDVHVYHTDDSIYREAERRFLNQDDLATYRLKDIILQNCAGNTHNEHGIILLGIERNEDEERDSAVLAAFNYGYTHEDLRRAIRGIGPRIPVTVGHYPDVTIDWVQGPYSYPCHGGEIRIGSSSLELLPEDWEIGLPEYIRPGENPYEGSTSGSLVPGTLQTFVMIRETEENRMRV